MKVQTHCNRTGNKMISLVYGINAPSTDRGRPEVLLKRVTSLQVQIKYAHAP